MLPSKTNKTGCSCARFLVPAAARQCLCRCPCAACCRLRLRPWYFCPCAGKAPAAAISANLPGFLPDRCGLRPSGSLRVPVAAAAPVHLVPAAARIAAGISCAGCWFLVSGSLQLRRVPAARPLCGLLPACGLSPGISAGKEGKPLQLPFLRLCRGFFRSLRPAARPDRCR